MDRSISVVIVNSRGNLHPDWVQTSIDSVKRQLVSCELIVINNLENKKTIGECWNLGVQKAKGDWVFFLGDDDFISSDYLFVLSNIAEKSNGVMVTSYRTIFRDDMSEAIPQTEIVTGMWKRDYLLKYPFNEELKRGVDREYIDKFKLRNDKHSVAYYHYGYFYRKHNDYSCAGDVKFIDDFDIYVVTKYPSFIEFLKKDNQVYISSKVEYEALDKAKVIWCDFLTEQVKLVADYECNAKKILRIHSFDAYGEAIKYTDFSKFDLVVFVSEQIADYVKEKYGIKNYIVIPNGVDLTKFHLSEHPKNNKIAYAGHISRKKGIGELLFIAKSLPEYEFHIAGKFQEDDVAEYLNKNLPKNVFLNSWQYDLSEFYKDKTYIINTSLRESQAMSILEGMACGLKPIVNEWLGSDKIYGKYVYKNLTDIVNLLRSEYNPKEYRKFVEENYNFENFYPKIKELLRN